MHRRDVALFETKEGLCFVTCRVARERILYEKIESALGKKQQAIQQLLLPMPLELDPLSAAAMESMQKEVSQNGFVIEEFGRNFFYRIEAIPAWMEPDQARAFIIDLLDLVREQGHLNKARKITDEIFIKLAVNRCRKSHKGQKKITPGDAMQTARELLQCQNIHTSPTGKATYIELTDRYLSEKFNNSV